MSTLPTPGDGDVLAQLVWSDGPLVQLPDTDCDACAEWQRDDRQPCEGARYSVAVIYPDAQPVAMGVCAAQLDRVLAPTAGVQIAAVILLVPGQRFPLSNVYDG